MADSEPLEADPADVGLAAVALAGIGAFAIVLPDGFIIGVAVLGMAILLAVVAVFQHQRA